MAKSKIYAVRNGRKIGIFYTWEETKQQVEGYKDAEYKSFKTLEEAISYLEGNDIVKEKKQNPPINVEDDLKKYDAVIFTDGSYFEEFEKYTWGSIIITKQNEIKLNGIGDNPDFSQYRNVSGEIYGVINSLEYCKKNNFKKIIIYHDYEGVSKWVNGSWKAKSPVVTYYIEKMKEYSDIYISFSWVKAHNKNKYNNIADKLAMTY